MRTDSTKIDDWVNASQTTARTARKTPERVAEEEERKEGGKNESELGNLHFNEV